MSYIPKQIKPNRDRVEVKLDRELIQQLEQYCRYLESDRDYVIGKALEVAFNKDKEFAEWLKTQLEPVSQNLPETFPDVSADKRRR